ncbi:MULTISPECIES: hypothetical protein [unclassified Sinorhizobium]|uniref:hypothetical protein n=1 Tax=unclassified Sinorhizobium TaxID=2613772 RepID=UPI003526AEF2
MSQQVDWVVVQLALEHRLFRCGGNEFQKLFSDIMQLVHGDDFIRVKPHGSLGDEGVDGYFLIGDIVYQCYGAEDGKVQKLSAVGEKMVGDFETAVENNPDMKEWKFTHNLLSGLPKQLLDVLVTLREKGASRNVKVGQLSLPGFLKLVDELDPRGRERILGTKAIAQDRLRQLPDAVNEIIDEVMEKAPTFALAAGPPQAISPRKLTHNDIPFMWQENLKRGFTYGSIVYDCVARHGDPDAATSAPSYFKNLYQNLDANGLAAGEILRFIHADLCGESPRFDDLRALAALGVMASMFENCEIFEDPPEGEPETLNYDPAQ